MPRVTHQAEHMEAIETVSLVHEGVPYALVKYTTILAADDPLVSAYPHFFRPLAVKRTRPLIEQTTAAPGEVRG